MLAGAVVFAASTAPPAFAATPSRVELPSPNPGVLTGTPRPLDATMPVALRVYLADRPGLADAARAVSDPASPRYAHFLTPAQAAQQFGPAPGQVGAVESWLAGQGMTVTATTEHYLAVNATVAQIDAAFGTQVSEFDRTVTEPKGGTRTFRDAGVVGGFSIPAAVAADIVSVTGIDQLELSPIVGGTTAAGARTATQPTDFPCSHYWGEHTSPIPPAFGHTTAPTQLCGYEPKQVRDAYGLSNSPYTGKGKTVAIILDEHSPTELADANRFFAAHGEPVFTPGQYVEDISPTSDASCVGRESGLEESIDVQSAHLGAPDARIVNVIVDCADFAPQELQSWLDGVSRVVDRHLADVASTSAGLGEDSLSPAGRAPWDLVLQQGALEGIGFDFSSGDGGAENLHQAQFPASNPWATAVGGTSLEIGAHGEVVAEHTWGDHLLPMNSDRTGYDEDPPGEFDGGSGGGLSTLFAEPGYQKAAVPRSLATDHGTTAAKRVIPDISADAGNAWLIGATDLDGSGGYAEVPIGGTSASSPLFAGIEADAMQTAGHALGFANPAIYRLAGGPAVRDILPVDPADPPIALGYRLDDEFDPAFVTTFGQDKSLPTTRGYDAATGLGAPTSSFTLLLGRR